MAEIADDKSTNQNSFDSALSENVFLGNSMTSKDFRDSMLLTSVGLEELNNKDSDDSESTTNSASAISYKQLQDEEEGVEMEQKEMPGQDDCTENDDSSNDSVLGIPTSSSDNLGILPDFLSESSQNLLGNEEDSEIDDLIEHSSEKEQFIEDDDMVIVDDRDVYRIQGGALAPPVSFPGLRPSPLVSSDGEKIYTESMQSSSSAFTQSEENLLSGENAERGSGSGVGSESPHISVSSETDILRFDLDLCSSASISKGVVGGSGGGDAQSIDSHMFTMLDKDKSLTMPNNMSDDGTMDRSTRDIEGEGTSLMSDDGSHQRVRFQGIYYDI